MEKELNIMAILKDKPKDTRLHDVARNVTVLFQEIEKYEIIKCSLIDGLILKYTNTGSMYQFPTGIEVLKPSKEMQDWSKFAWERGDLLVNNAGFEVIFDRWANDDYTEFCGKIKGLKGIGIYNTNNHTLKKKIEQPKQEFNEGDIVFVKGETKDSNSIGIVMNAGNGLNYHYWANYFYKTGVLRVAESCDDYVVGHSRYEEVRLANSSEKQQLFSALEKEGKCWNPDTLRIEDLPKKCEFKQMDLCLMRRYSCTWELCQFAYQETNGNRCYHTINGAIFHDCIPYNKSTKHLLGTTDEWKGGEG